jgi:hypothetical protein
VLQLTTSVDAMVPSTAFDQGLLAGLRRMRDVLLHPRLRHEDAR